MTSNLHGPGDSRQPVLERDENQEARKKFSSGAAAKHPLP
jgi:hypothetical protein